MQRRTSYLLPFAVSVLLLAPTAASAQNLSSPLSNVVLAGYGSAMYNGATNGDFTNNFSAAVSPIVLYQMGDNILFETELEFGLEGPTTETELEYAQIDYQGFERVQIIGGKFLLPFGLFGERLHPTWINKMPTMPLVYGHAHGGVAEGSLLPVLSDAGILGRLKEPVSDDWALDVSAWVSQGPRLVTEGEMVDEHDHGAAKTASPAHEDDGHAAGDIEVPAVGFGISFGDNNSNKMIGGRVGLVHGPSLEFYVSGFHARYDPEGALGISGSNVAFDFRHGAIEVRGEGALLWQQFEHTDGMETLQSAGYYVQASRRMGAFEPVVRWAHLPQASVEGAVARVEQRRLALGVNYWIQPSVPVKLAYEINLDGTDGLFLQWAFGF